MVQPPPDALDQFTVQTNNYSAQFGHAEGAVLNAETKAGTNQLHGNLFEFMRNDKLDAALVVSGRASAVLDPEAVSTGLSG